MDLCSYPGEDDDIFRGTPALGWEDADVLVGSQSGVELSQGDFQDESADSLADESGPLLRCLKRIYRKVKKERTRRRRTMTAEEDGQPLSMLHGKWSISATTPGCDMDM
ncbi:hypothetical protein JD844_033768 [Phrynosoma platyrhinos]|uniref:Uncharacterized protein n=1 Tax=Phrynosoma platyrhinos TaxID=52577 RepID=A0ABQ7T6Z1_PHRPL|nr:hypothetical protein JD844_033768 [Phrynosoma platyrhinos]